jgi:hypothetical protein
MKRAKKESDNYYEIWDDEELTHVMIVVSLEWELYRVTEEIPNLQYLDRDIYRHDLLERNGIKIE